MTLRLDRIVAWSVSEVKKPVLSYGRKFRDGDIRNLRVDSFMGKEVTVRVRFRYDHHRFRSISYRKSFGTNRG